VGQSTPATRREIIARIRAVLVGVDAYERPDVPPLRGCVNDVVLMRRVLKRCFGVPNEDIRVLVDHRATKDNVLRRLWDTVRRAEPGDVVIFYFSGHGSQIRDRDGDELTDALDELLCPYDMDWDRGTYILDDDLDAIFASLPSGVLLEAVFDCCFWGATPREFVWDPGPQAQRADVRYLTPPVDIAARAEGDEDRLAYHRIADAAPFGRHHVFWAGSREGQMVTEDFFEGRVHGTFTYWYCRFLEDHFERTGGRYPRGRLFEDTREYLRGLGYPQTPELLAPSALRRRDPFTTTDAAAWAYAPRPPGGPR
jgi:metacaspase-1